MPTFRVSSPDTLARLQSGLTAPIVEAVKLKIPDGRSLYRVWTDDGKAYHLVPKGGRLSRRLLGLRFSPPSRETRYDRRPDKTPSPAPATPHPGR